MGLPKEARVALGHWEVQTQADTYSHRRDRGPISDAQRDFERDILEGRISARDLAHAKGKGKGKAGGDSLLAGSWQEHRPHRPHSRARSRTGGRYANSPPAAPSRAPSRPSTGPSAAPGLVATRAHMTAPTRPGLQVGGSSSSASCAKAPPTPGFGQPYRREAPSAASSAAAGDRPTSAYAAKGERTDAAGKKGAPKGARAAASSSRPKSRSAPKGARATTPSARSTSRGAPKGGRKGGPKGAQKGIPPRTGGGDVRILRREDELLQPNNVWACPICGIPHEDGAGISYGRSSTRFTCESCGGIIACRNTACDGWIAVDYGGPCRTCGSQHRS